MAIRVRIFQESPIRLWGLSSRERLEKMLDKAGITVDGEQVPGEGDSVLLLRGDFLYDQRLIKSLAAAVGVVLEADSPHGPRPVAAHVPAELGETMETILTGGHPAVYPQGVRQETASTLGNAYLKELLKFDVPFLLPITDKNRRRLEKRLFDGSYKGVTDLVTKWLWPVPARWATRLCTRYGIVPNHVTSLSLLLSILALPLFWQGWYVTGLVCAWLMTFLDTVDGKLARVTLNYSPFGHIFDHIIDLVFPPLWYIAWTLSLPDIPGLTAQVAIWMIMGGYIAGRLVEITFTKGLESSGIFCWQPVDSCFRLITGRRNPNLGLLTASLFIGRPDVGLLAVCLWTVLSTLFLVGRLVMGIRDRIRSGPLRSWFADLDPAADNLAFYQKWFCRLPKDESSWNA